MSKPAAPLVDRLMEMFIPEPMSGCWLWLGHHNKSGHGKITIADGTKRGRKEYAHRVSWLLFRGPIPDGLHVLHDCDNPFCVNPDHLHLGTHADNMREASERGYSWKNRSKKLDLDAVKHILASPETGSSLAKKFGVSPGMISMVRRRKTWTHPSLNIEGE